MGTKLAQVNSANKHIANIQGIASTIYTASNIYNHWRETYTGKVYYGITMSSSAYIYDEVMEWLHQSTSSKRFIVKSDRQGLKSHFGGASTGVVEVDGYRVKIKLESGKEKTVVDDDNVVVSTANSSNVVFLCKYKGGIEAVKAHLDEISSKKLSTVKRNYLYFPDSYGWGAKTLRNRELDSVFLPQGVKEELIADFDHFLNSEEQYRRLGLPFHRGYLFYGSPGNGKTSLAASLASHYGRDLYSLPLSAVENDTKFTKLINNMDPNAILLLEDIDIFSASMKREGENNSVTLAGVLNALDGVGTPYGMITIMTTNRVEVLDNALTRPGRVDMQLELKKPNRYQTEQMFERAFNEPLGVKPKSFASTAELSHLFKAHVFDAEAARAEIKGE